MADIEFEDFSMKVKAKLDEVVVAWLHEAGGEVKSIAQRNSRVDTGQTKGSYAYVVDESKGEVTIGSPLQNAIWEEFGTGQYALNGNGRKTPWKYKDRKGVWHKTKGKKPNRPLHNSFVCCQPKLKQSLENKLKGI